MDGGAIRASADAVEEANAEIGRTLPNRGTPEGREEWSAACRLFWSRLEAFYDVVGLDCAAVRRGDGDARERAISLLEADPHCHRSGYLMEQAATALANARLDEHDRARLRAVVLHQVRTPRARMLRPTSRLAAAVWNDDLARSLIQMADREVNAARLPERAPRWGAHSDMSVRVAMVIAGAEQRRRSLAGGRPT